MKTSASALLLLALGCTQVELYKPVDDDPPIPRERLYARVCGPAERTLPTPYKILFVVDTSASNLINETDPPMYNGLIDLVNGVTRRETSVRSAISAHQAKPDVSFGIITFNDFPQVQTFGFTRDLKALDAAVRNIGAATGWTNYSDTLIRAGEVITGDLGRVDASEALRTHYLVFWISDGYPTRGITHQDPEVLSKALGDFVKGIKEGAAGRAAEVRFNTAFLGGGKPMGEEDPLAWAQEAENARRLLASMAEVGGGSFTNIAAGEPIAFDINPAPVLRRFRLSTVVVANRSVVFGDVRPRPDTDQDGLGDLEDPDPRNADTDGDGLRDGVEAQFPGGDPLAKEVPGGCASAGLDSDGDALWDCEEAFIGTDPNNPDTDGDLLLDSLEVRARASPLNAANLDLDGDGLGEQAEVLAQLNAREPNPPDVVKRWARKWLVSPDGAAAGGSLCYQVEVANLYMLETLAAAGEPAGSNTLEVVAAFEPDDGGKPIFHFRATAGGVFRGPNYVEPASRMFELDSSAFGGLR
ncbi:MAG: VWA domain-containing protein [Myxococcales bacterium]|nr:VWA domain-containing protein [Myxococcales bacterium]